MSVNLDDLERFAKAATPGPWTKVRTSPVSLNVYSGDDLVLELITSRSDMDPEANADFIARAPTWLALACDLADAAKDTLAPKFTFQRSMTLPRSERICSALHTALDAWEQGTQ